MSWTAERYQNYIAELKSQGDAKYREFTEKIVSTKYPIIGLRMPFLKKEAKKISRDDPESFLSCVRFDTYEEVLLEALVIANITDLDTYLSYFDSFLDKIDNWAVCDTLVSSSKIMSKERNCFFRKGRILIRSKEPFVARVGFVIFLTHCVTGHYPKQMFPLITHYQSDSYYVGMAIAWLLSVLLIDFYDETKGYLEENHLSKFILQKTVSKACDSYRLSKEQKDELRALKKRLIH